MKYKNRKHAKRKYKKALLATVATMTLGVSTLGSTVSVFAVENKIQTRISKESSVAAPSLDIQGYLIKNGIKNPVYKGGVTVENYDSGKVNIAYPQLPSNPTDSVPSQGAITSKTADYRKSNVIYFSKIPVNSLLTGGSATTNELFKGELENIAIEKINESSFSIYSFNSDTLEKIDNVSYTSSSSMLKSLFEGNKLKRENQFRLKSHKLLPRTASYKYVEGIKSGLTKETALGGGLTLGAKFSASGEAHVPFILSTKFSAEVSAQLSFTYNAKTSITQEKTSSEEIAFPGVTNSSYKYDEYSIALYQLNSIYTLEPGPALQKMISQGAVLAKDSFEYNDSTTYLAVTPGAASKN
ncbi:hypothetical protein [Bacillus cereus]|uniref:hypothetical protein n=1 Tax=Bacillus cereus TaxID=1396 RepID=UPI0018F761CB|nr:hypothetical protein [Bacillus cereus]MBJ8025684.1 hypothetical protein [Bacillus cereus]MBJ8038041.1 hypothetical protein [Bacillus cereus]